MKRLTTSLRLLLALIIVEGLAACSGGPLKELPVFEPPPEPVEETPPPPPAAEPEPEEIFGAWSSTSLRGPGSAAFREMLVAFGRDGSFVEAAFGPQRREARAGTFDLMDGALRIDLRDGHERVWIWELADGALILRDGGTEIRLARLR